MKFGLNESQWSLVENLLIFPLKRMGSEVWIFGSRARGDHHEFSDLDVLISNPTPLPPGILSEIRENLEESRLPIKVDIVYIEDLAQTYKTNILRERILI